MTAAQLVLENVSIDPSTCKLSGTLKNTGGTVTRGSGNRVYLPLLSISNGDATVPDGITQGFDYAYSALNSGDTTGDSYLPYFGLSNEYTHNTDMSISSPGLHSKANNATDNNSGDLEITEYTYLYLYRQWIRDQSAHGHIKLQLNDGTTRIVNAISHVVAIYVGYPGIGPGDSVDFNVPLPREAIRAAPNRHFALVADGPYGGDSRSGWSSSTGDTAEAIDQHPTVDANGNTIYSQSPEERIAIMNDVTLDTYDPVDVNVTITNFEPKITLANTSGVRYDVNANYLDAPVVLKVALCELTDEETYVHSTRVTTLDSATTPGFTLGSFSIPMGDLVGRYVGDFIGKVVKLETSPGVFKYVKSWLAFNSHSLTPDNLTASGIMYGDYILARDKQYAVVADLPWATGPENPVARVNNNFDVIDSLLCEVDPYDKHPNLLKETRDIAKLDESIVYQVGRGMNYRFLNTNTSNVLPETTATFELTGENWHELAQLKIKDSAEPGATGTVLIDTFTLSYEVVETKKLEVTLNNNYKRGMNLTAFQAYYGLAEKTYGRVGIRDINDYTEEEFKEGHTYRLSAADGRDVIWATDAGVGGRTKETYLGIINRDKGLVSTPPEDGSSTHNPETNWALADSLTGDIKFYMRVPVIGQYELQVVDGGFDEYYRLYKPWSVKVLDENNNPVYTIYERTSNDHHSGTGIYLNQNFTGNLRYTSSTDPSGNPYVYEIEDLSNVAYHRLPTTLTILPPPGVELQSFKQGEMVSTNVVEGSVAGATVYTIGSIVANTGSTIDITFSDPTYNVTGLPITRIAPSEDYDDSPYRSDFEVLNPVLDVDNGVVKFTVRQNGPPFNRDGYDIAMVVVAVSNEEGPLGLEPFHHASSVDSLMNGTVNENLLHEQFYQKFAYTGGLVTEIGDSAPIPVEWEADINGVMQPVAWARAVIGASYLHTNSSNLNWLDEEDIVLPLVDGDMPRTPEALISRWGSKRFAIIYDHSLMNWNGGLGSHSYEGGNFSYNLVRPNGVRPGNPAELNNLHVFTPLSVPVPNMKFFMGSAAFNGEADRAANELVTDMELDDIQYRASADLSFADLKAAMRDVAIKYSTPGTDFDATPLSDIRINVMMAIQTVDSPSASFDISLGSNGDAGKIPATLTSLFDSDNNNDSVEFVDSAGGVIHTVELSGPDGFSFASALPKALCRQISFAGSNEVVGRNVIETASKRNLCAFGVKEVGAFNEAGDTVSLNSLLAGAVNDGTKEMSWEEARNSSSDAPNNRFLAHELVLAIFRNAPPTASDISVDGADAARRWAYNTTTGLLSLQALDGLDLTLEFVLLSELNVKDSTTGDILDSTIASPAPGGSGSFAWESNAVDVAKRVAIRFSLNVV